MNENVVNTASCYCLKTRKASASITQFYNGILKPSGVTVRQFFLLQSISQAVFCSVRELSDITGLDRSTLARSLKPLYHQGLIIDNKDLGSRNSQLKLTQAGTITLKQAKQLWDKAQITFMQKIGKEGADALEKAFQALKDL